MTRRSNTRFASCNHLGQGSHCHRCAAAAKLIADADRGMLDGEELVRLRAQYEALKVRAKAATGDKADQLARRAESAKVRSVPKSFTDAEKMAMRAEAKRLQAPQAEKGSKKMAQPSVESL